MQAMFGTPMHLLKDKTLIENVQKFGLRICAKRWDLSYNELLSSFTVSTLQSRRLEHKLSAMFKIVHNLIIFPPSVFVPCQSRTGSNAYLRTQTLFCTLLFLALIYYGIHYLVMSLAYLHFLFLKLTCT